MRDNEFSARIETLLSRNQDIVQSMMEQVSDIVFFASSAGELTYISPMGPRILGYAEADVLGKPFDAYIHPDDKPVCTQAFKRVMLKGESVENLEHRLKTEGNDYRWYLTNVIPLRDNTGKVVLCMGISRDITERKMAEDKCLWAENYYRSIMENSLDAILVLDHNGNVQYETSAYKRMVGYSAVEGTAKGLYMPVHPDDLPLAESGFLEMAANTPGVLVRRELRIRHQDGSWLTVQIIANNLLSIPEVQAYVVHIRNVTERRKAEKKLQYQAEFERLITRMSTEFINLESESINEGLDYALKLIGDFSIVDRSYIFQFSEDGKTISNTHEWCAPGIEPQIEYLQNMPSDENQWMMENVYSREVIFIPSVAELPPEAELERQVLEEQDIKSLTMVPIICGGELLGCLGFDSVRGETEWTEETTALLKLVGEMMGNLLVRKRSDDMLKEARDQLERKVKDRTSELAESNKQLKEEISKQKRAERLLKQSEMLFRSIIENSHDVFVLLSADGKVTYESPSIERVTGYTPEERSGRPFLELIHPDDANMAHHDVASVMEAPGMVKPVSVRITHKEGALRWIEGTLKNCLDLPGVNAIVCNYRDVTDRRQVETRLRNYANQLAQANEELSQYAQVVCHDMCTPLRAVRMYTHLLRQDIPSASPGESLSHLDTIERAVIEGQQMAQDLLAYGQLYEEQMRYEKINMDILTNNVISLFALYPDVEITRLKKKWPVIEGVPMLLHQVFNNLIDNAIKFNESSQKKIKVGWKRIDGEGYEFFVRDNGPGVAPEYHEKIFQIFGRVHPRERYDGSGMGLAIVKKAVTRLNGRVWVTSKPGNGSTFHVFLPEQR